MPEARQSLANGARSIAHVTLGKATPGTYKGHLALLMFGNEKAPQKRGRNQFDFAQFIEPSI